MYGLCTTVDKCVFLLAQGYWGPHGFITAQTPLPDTTADFWLMVYQKKASTIVMLADYNEGDKVLIVQECTVQYFFRRSYRAVFWFIYLLVLLTAVWLYLLGKWEENIWGLWGGVDKHRHVPNFYHPQHADPSHKGNSTAACSHLVKFPFSLPTRITLCNLQRYPPFHQNFINSIACWFNPTPLLSTEERVSAGETVPLPEVDQHRGETRRFDGHDQAHQADWRLWQQQTWDNHTGHRPLQVRQHQRTHKRV